MSIIRAVRPESGFLIVRNDVIRDVRLSLKARGLLMFILSRPDNWETDAETLAEENHVGRDAILSGLAELKANGYMRQEKHRDSAGRISTQTYIYDQPEAALPETENPFPVPTRGNGVSPLVAPEAGLPAPENPTPIEEPSTKEPRNVSDEPETTKAGPEVDALCSFLADRIEANGSKRPAITQAWLTSCRLLLDKDGRTAEQVRKAINWCQDDEFWRGNILSMPTLRKQYDRLRLAANRGNNNVTPIRRVGWEAN